MLSDPPGGAQTVKNQILFALCGIHDFLSFSVFSVSEKYFYAKTHNFLKKSEFHRKSQKSLQAARWPKVFVFLLFRSSIFIHFHDFS